MNLLINKEIKQLLKEAGISINDGIPVLLSIYFNLKPDYLPQDLVRKVLSAKIVTMNYKDGTSEIEWVVPLFQGEVKSTFDWIGEFMDLFSAVNTERRGIRSYVEKYMRKLFAENPDIRKDEVFSATKAYISEVDNPMYLMKSHKFISNRDGTPLLDKIIEMRENQTKHIENPFKRII